MPGHSHVKHQVRTARGLSRLAAAAALLLAAACTSSNATSQGPTIDFWYLPNGIHPEQYMQDAVKAFNVGHPNIRINATKLSRADAYSKLGAALPGGAGPDVAQVDTTWVGALAKAGGLHEFTPDEVRAIGVAGAFAPAIWESSGKYKTSQTTAIPWFVDTRAVFYRTDVLKSLGIEPANAFGSWEDFDHTLDAIQRSGKIAALGVAGKNATNPAADFAPWVWEAGGSLLSEDGATPEVSEARSVNGFDEYQRLGGKYVPPAVLQKNSADVEAMFAAGKFAVTISGPSLAQQLQLPKTQGGFGDDVAARSGFATTPLPGGPAGRLVYVGGSNLVILKSTRHEDAAYAWVQFLAGVEGQTNYVSRIGMYPALLSAAGASVFAGNKYLAAFKVQVNTGRQFPTVAAWPSIEKILAADLGTVWDTVIADHQPMAKDALQTVLEKAATDMQAAINQAA